MLKRKILGWLASQRRFIKQRFGTNVILLLLSFFIGVLGATAAIIIKNLLHFTTSALSNTFPEAQINYFYLTFPLIGLILTVFFVTRIVKDDLSHGVSIALKAICKSNGRLRRHNIYSSMVASSITVGFGGSVGLEAPIVLTGSAIGSNLARLFNLNAKNTTLLLACGSTAALAAIFKAPVTAIVFAVEVLMLDLTSAAILPLLISAATGTVLSILFLGDNVMFSIPYTQSFALKNIPFYIILGLLTGFISVYFLRILRFIEKFFSKMKRKYLKAILGGLALGTLIFLLPVLFGEGYESINALLNGNIDVLYKASPLYRISDQHVMFIIFIILIIFIKVIASAVTTASGGIGGVFAPTLFVGAFVGYLVAEVVNYYFGIEIPYINFVLAGMAGVMTGVMLAPLTATFLIAEVSTGYALLIPLMITSSISYLSVYPFEKYSIYTRKLAEKGDLKTHNKDKFALRKLNWLNIVDCDILTIPNHSTLRTYTQYIAKSKRNLFVVVDDDSLFSGLLVMDHHREKIFRQELYDTVCVEDLMIEPEEFIYDTDNCEEVIDKFNRTGNFNMPVITKDRKYIGFLSKAKLLAVYRDFIASESED
ncbi:MAG: chloride channel protein [Bacteroidales bacterium]